jgi:antitoxin CptB
MLACALFGRNADLCKADADIAAEAVYIHRSRPRPGFWRLEQQLDELSSEGLDGRRRRLLFRCRHRGIREMDLVLGRFAVSHLASLSEAELDELERWLEIPDQQIFAWVNGSEPTPPEFDSALFKRLRAVHGRMT